MIKAVLFDLDDTLFATSEFVATARKNAVNAMIHSGLMAESEEAIDELSMIVCKYGSNFRKHFDVLCEKFNGKNSAEIVSAGIIAYHNAKVKSLAPDKNIITPLKYLKKQNIRLGIITAGIKVKQWEKIHRLGLREFMDIIVISDTLSKEIMLINALEKLNIRPEESLFVGDRIDSDIISANRIGMSSAQILQGNYRNMVQTSAQETPDYKITHITELKKILAPRMSKKARFWFF